MDSVSERRMDYRYPHFKWQFLVAALSFDGPSRVHPLRPDPGITGSQNTWSGNGPAH